jgi:hypothetical protein
VANLTFSDSVVVARPAEFLYDMISDVTRMGEWSPVCTTCWWDDGNAAQTGAWFTGRNDTADRTWETRCQVAAAERGRIFEFVVGGSWIRWGYTFTEVAGGTEVTESWEFLPAGIARFEERFGADAPAQIRARTEDAHAGIPATLAAIKKVAESA